MIVSEHMTRVKALLDLQMSMYNEKEMEFEIIQICKELKITKEEFDKVMKTVSNRHAYHKIDKFYILYRKSFYVITCKKKFAT